jgi:RNA polymerase sigma factor (sigma-70 family)
MQKYWYNSRHNFKEHGKGGDYLEQEKLNTDDLCAMIAEKYYHEIYGYCYYKLNFDTNAAQECVQDTFLVMIQKKKRLNLNFNMRSWLYKTADRVIKHYWRKEKKRKLQVPIDEIELADDGGLAFVDCEQQFECLTKDELELLTAYYEAEHGTRSTLAQEYHMTIYELYREIDRIKKKIRSLE